VTSDPRAFLALDLGAATSSVALIGRIAHRWRLVGALSMPAAGDVDAIATELLRRVAAADVDLAAMVGLTDDNGRVDPVRLTSELPRLVARSAPPRTMLVVAVSRRTISPLVAAARSTGWRVRQATLEGSDPLSLTSSLLDPAVDVLLVGAGDPPGADERAQLGELAVVVAAAVARRRAATVVLAGAMAEQLDRISLSFLVDDLAIRKGGSGANIAFGLGVLGQRPLLVGVVIKHDDSGAGDGNVVLALAMGS